MGREAQLRVGSHAPSLDTASPYPGIANRAGRRHHLAVLLCSMEAGPMGGGLERGTIVKFISLHTRGDGTIARITPAVTPDGRLMNCYDTPVPALTLRAPLPPRAANPEGVADEQPGAWFVPLHWLARLDAGIRSQVDAVQPLYADEGSPFDSTGSSSPAYSPHAPPTVHPSQSGDPAVRAHYFESCAPSSPETWATVEGIPAADLLAFLAGTAAAATSQPLGAPFSPHTPEQWRSPLARSPLRPPLTDIADIAPHISPRIPHSATHGRGVTSGADATLADAAGEPVAEDETPSVADTCSALGPALPVHQELGAAPMRQRPADAQADPTTWRAASQSSDALAVKPKRTGILLPVVGSWARRSPGVAAAASPSLVLSHALRVAPASPAHCDVRSPLPTCLRVDRTLLAVLLLRIESGSAGLVLEPGTIVEVFPGLSDGQVRIEPALNSDGDVLRRLGHDGTGPLGMSSQPSATGAGAPSWHAPLSCLGPLGAELRASVMEAEPRYAAVDCLDDLTLPSLSPAFPRHGSGAGGVFAFIANTCSALGPALLVHQEVGGTPTDAQADPTTWRAASQSSDALAVKPKRTGILLPVVGSLARRSPGVATAASPSLVLSHALRVAPASPSYCDLRSPLPTCVRVDRTLLAVLLLRIESGSAGLVLEPGTIVKVFPGLSDGQVRIEPALNSDGDVLRRLGHDGTGPLGMSSPPSATAAGAPSWHAPLSCLGPLGAELRASVMEAEPRYAAVDCLDDLTPPSLSPASPRHGSSDGGVFSIPPLRRDSPGARSVVISPPESPRSAHLSPDTSGMEAAAALSPRASWATGFGHSPPGFAETCSALRMLMEAAAASSPLPSVATSYGHSPPGFAETCSALRMLMEAAAASSPLLSLTTGNGHSPLGFAGACSPPGMLMEAAAAIPSPREDAHRAVVGLCGLKGGLLPLLLTPPPRTAPHGAGRVQLEQISGFDMILFASAAAEGSGDGDDRFYGAAAEGGGGDDRFYGAAAEGGGADDRFYGAAAEGGGGDGGSSGGPGIAAAEGCENIASGSEYVDQAVVADTLRSLAEESPPPLGERGL